MPEETAPTARGNEIPQPLGSSFVVRVSSFRALFSSACALLLVFKRLTLRYGLLKRSKRSLTLLTILVNYALLHHRDPPHSFETAFLLFNVIDSLDSSIPLPPSSLEGNSNSRRIWKFVDLPHFCCSVPLNCVVARSIAILLWRRHHHSYQIMR